MVCYHRPGTNGYALALRKTQRIHSLADINGYSDLAPGMASDLEAFSH